MLFDKILKKLDAVDEPYTILFFGDSSISGESVHPNWRGIVEYVIKDRSEHILSDWQKPYLLIRCVNAGIDGGTTSQFLKYLPRDLKHFKPNLVVFMGGDNDIPINVPFDTTIDNLNKIRKLLSENTDDFIFSSGQKPKDEKHATANAKYLEVLGSQSLYRNEIFINLYDEFESRHFDLSKIYTYRLPDEDAIANGLPIGSLDMHHTNRIGQCYVAQVILEKVFGIDFDPDLYLRTLDLAVKREPQY